MLQLLSPNPKRKESREGTVLRSSRQSLLRLAALSLAVLLALFLVQVTTHFHANGQEQAACNRCHLAHLAIGFEKTHLFLPAPLLAVGWGFELILTVHNDPVSLHSSSRAPPTA